MEIKKETQNLPKDKKKICRFCGNNNYEEKYAKHLRSKHNTMNNQLDLKIQNLKKEAKERLEELIRIRELLTTEQKKELEERLWKKNTLDALVPPSERIQLKSEDYQRISQLTQETKEFIRQLEKGTEWEGQIDKEIIANRHKTIRQWIEENAQK
ncbi:815_t:CDS:2 [Racocetra fulgida]|uniref:815_t:CDS:1 n=1 Tax=Racocetra fulgida TaxID=60492 RepID=A0A9N8VE99_9GLOM|nr:815_t:CDS:2 [Racocetra fulgida]